MVQAPPPSAETLLSAEQIITALDRKRALLDEEIARFTAWKEKEYLRYGDWLRTKARQGDLEGAPLDRVEGDEKEEEKDGEEEGWRARAWGEESIGRNGEKGKEVDDLFSKSSRTSGGADPPNGVKGDGASPATEGNIVRENRSDGDQIHDRDLEFAGVFTPPFLPLLDGGGGGSRPTSSSHEGAAPKREEETPASITDNNEDTPNTSSEITPTTPPPPAPTRRSSIRHPTLSSLPTRTSTASAGDTQLPPRSPKRVMLALDDSGTVVSPGTSPVVERKAGSGVSRVGRRSRRGVENGVGDGFEIVRRKGRGRKGEREREKVGWANRVAAGAGAGAAGNYYGMELPTGGESKGTWAIGGARRGGAGGEFGSEQLVGGDWDDGDGVFEFDEDLAMGSSSGRDLEKELGTEEDELTGVEEPSGGDGAVGTSPHAGSLPIEIKWPERRGRGGR